MTHYGMTIDLTRCIGCQSCAVICKTSNNVPEGVWWNRVTTDGGAAIDTGRGEWPNVTLDFVPISCQHCEDPACVKVCPVGATFKDPETGIVRQDTEKCIGCRMCMAHCPYTGVRSYNWEQPKKYFDFDMGCATAPDHVKHTVEKCTFCYNRISAGEEPSCMILCPARARHWGDLDDPESAVSKLIRTREYKQLLPEKGTKPSVYYLV